MAHSSTIKKRAWYIDWLATKYEGIVNEDLIHSIMPDPTCSELLSKRKWETAAMLARNMLKAFAKLIAKTKQPRIISVYNALKRGGHWRLAIGNDHWRMSPGSWNHCSVVISQLFQRVFAWEYYLGSGNQSTAPKGVAKPESITSAVMEWFPSELWCKLISKTSDHWGKKVFCCSWDMYLSKYIEILQQNFSNFWFPLSLCGSPGRRR